jgi:hypothetical protein
MRADTMTDAASDFATQANRTQRSITVDNFMRKALRVADPRNPDQIANALLARYPEEADRTRREREGLPYSSAGNLQQAVAVAASAGSVELETARSDLERDLSTITTLSQLKEISVELNGWGRAIRRAAADGIAAARLALDAVSRDTALAARRTLCEYARLARYVGAMSDGSGLYFRRLAQSCDVLSALILVAIGEGLAANGITRSTSLVRVSAGELQSRRNAVITALRGLTGSLDQTLGQEDYPRGIVGYQMLVANLEAGGQADLRALLEENALSSAMDQLVDLTTGANIEGLRELSTTASLLTGRFTRLIQYGQAVPIYGPPPLGGYPAPESPPLTNFIAALQLFVDAFTASGSNRLLFVARPPILAYGLYGSLDQLPATRLQALVVARGNLVTAIDCFAGCGCDIGGVQCLVMFDFVLSIIDRAIDLLAVGTDPNGAGEAEKRAIAAALLSIRMLSFAQGEQNAQPLQGWNVLCTLSPEIVQAVSEIRAQLLTPFIPGNPIPPPPPNQLPGAILPIAARELQVAYLAESQTETVVRNLLSGCANSLVLRPRLGGIVGNFDERTESIVRLLIRRTYGQIMPGGDVGAATTIKLPDTLARSNAARSWQDPRVGYPN